MEIISLKMDKGLLHKIDSTLKDYKYSTRTEFIRDAIRSKLTELEKQEAIRKLAAFKGSLRKGKQTTDKELRRIREEVGHEYAKKFGIDLD